MDGILLLDKPVSWTSHDLVDAVRRKTGQRAVGHAGTLDPMATGLMILLLGASTKRSAVFSGLDKSYRGSIRLGVVTDSWDLDGRILEESPVPSLTENEVLAAMARLTGECSLATPAFSAVKRKGRKAYELARRGESVEMAPREVRIDRLQLEAFDAPEVYFDIDCSKGTYVRSVAMELGRTFGCGGTLSSLVRTRIGSFKLAEAWPLERFENAPLEALERRLLSQ